VEAAPALPRPAVPDWVRDGRPDDAVVIDLGHPMGTTRMSDDPATGVVDGNCRVHGVDGLFVAGGSVIPTSGHANPTLMMLALTLRLADHLLSGRRRA
jgi:choline dehydrogenase-like flavoprotein